MRTLLILTLLFTVRCSSPETSPVDTGLKNDTAAKETKTTDLPTLTDGCYSWVVKRDTARMKLHITGSEVSGELQYAWFEKDRNSGNIKGTIKGDLLIADYIFQSEGMTSVRQVVFKIKDKSLIEGTGEYDTRSDTLRFKNTEQLNFQHNNVFTRIDCSY